MKTNTFRSYIHNVVVRELCGYEMQDNYNMPIWGKRLAIYHPVTSELTYLDEEAWEVFDAAQSNTTVYDIVKKTTIYPKRIESIITKLIASYILIPSNESVSVTACPDFKSEAELYMQVTEACNFACPGCATGVDRFKAGEAKTLDSKTLADMLTIAVQSCEQKGIKSLRVKWAGGEVLMPLSFQLLKGAQPVISNLKKRHTAVAITQIILTNGSHFREDVVKTLSEIGTHLSVSLWGLGSTNDVSRGIRRDMDKYPHLIEGIRRLHEAGVGFNIDHVVTPSNAAGFKEFMRAMWDSEDDVFIAKDWIWNEPKRPLAMGIEFFRPQTLLQMAAMKATGYKRMVNGIRGGFDLIRELIVRGLPIQPFDRIDYLQLFGMIPSPCGTGFNYFAAGPRGVASCHQALFDMKSNIAEILSGEKNFINTANSEYDGTREQLIGTQIRFEGVDKTMETILKLHGGSGCPRTARDENQGKLGSAASSAAYLYAPIIHELLSIETMRRIKRSQQFMGISNTNVRNAQGGDFYEV